jgi:adenylate cyclase
VLAAFFNAGEFHGSFAGPRRLKGIKSEVKLFRVRRGAGSEEYK